MVTKTYLLSRVWVWTVILEAVSAAGLFIWAGWGSGALLGLGGMPLRLAATLVSVGSVILLRLAYVMSRQRELLHIDGQGVAGREPSGDAWPDAAEFRIPWDQLAAVEVAGSLMQRVHLVDCNARTHTVALMMVTGLKGGQGAVLADEIRSAHAEWRSRSAP